MQRTNQICTIFATLTYLTLSGEMQLIQKLTYHDKAFKIGDVLWTNRNDLPKKKAMDPWKFAQYLQYTEIIIFWPLENFLTSVILCTPNAMKTSAGAMCTQSTSGACTLVPAPYVHKRRRLCTLKQVNITVLLESRKSYFLDLGGWMGLKHYTDVFKIHFLLSNNVSDVIF